MKGKRMHKAPEANMFQIESFNSTKNHVTVNLKIKDEISKITFCKNNTKIELHQNFPVLFYDIKKTHRIL